MNYEKVEITPAQLLLDPNNYRFHDIRGYKAVTQIGADALGLAMEDVTARIADSSLPKSPVEGGSWTAASAGSAVDAACKTVREELFGYARKMKGSPLANATIDQITFANGCIILTADPTRSVSLVEAMRAGGVERIEAEETASPSMLTQMRYSAYTHSAIFVEVRVDEELGVLRVTRIVNAVAAGKILNPKTTRSQIVGGVVWAWGWRC